MRGAQRLCRVEDVVEGSPVPAHAEGFPPLAVFRVGDALHLTSNRCTHGTGLLTEGEQIGALVECPVHSGVFDITTGQAVGFPCRVPLPKFALTVEDGWVCVSGQAVSIAAAADSGAD